MGAAAVFAWRVVVSYEVVAIILRSASKPGASNTSSLLAAMSRWTFWGLADTVIWLLALVACVLLVRQLTRSQVAQLTGR